MKKSLRTQMVTVGGLDTAKKIADGEQFAVGQVLPIYLSSVFAFSDMETLDEVYEGTKQSYTYTRCGNPNLDAAAEMMAVAENAEAAVCFASGMSAITLAFLAHVKAGDHIVASTVLYGDVFNYLKYELPAYGIETTFVDFSDEAAFEAAFRPETKIVYTETICNPLMDVADIPAAAEMAHKHGAKLFIDNSFASPAVCRPIDLGADLVAESVTKFIGGHSDLTGGVISGSEELIAPIRYYSELFGAIMGPFEAWLLMRSLRTLDLRVKAHSENGAKVAAYLEQHPKITRVCYPGLASSPYKELADKMFVDGRAGGMLAFEVVGDLEGALKLIESFKSITIVPSLATYNTSVTHPGKTSHRRMSAADREASGITMGLLRLSIGIEDPDDIIADFEQALEQI